jgi:hypothetical protein
MGLPELVRRQAERELAAYCEHRVPASVRDQVRLEYEFRGNSATIIERRVPWHPALEGESWTRMPIAQLRYDPERGRWTLFWPDRNTRWHEDDGVSPAKTLAPLLAEVDEDPTGIYWG